MTCLVRPSTGHTSYSKLAKFRLLLDFMAEDRKHPGPTELIMKTMIYKLDGYITKVCDDADSEARATK